MIIYAVTEEYQEKTEFYTNRAAAQDHCNAENSPGYTGFSVQEVEVKDEYKADNDNT